MVANSQKLLRVGSGKLLVIQLGAVTALAGEHRFLRRDHFRKVALHENHLVMLGGGKQWQQLRHDFHDFAARLRQP